MNKFRSIYWEEYVNDRDGSVTVRPYRYRVGQEIKYNKKPAFIERIEWQVNLQAGIDVAEIYIKNEDNEVTSWVIMPRPRVILKSDVEYILDEYDSDETSK